ncbi:MULTISPECIES: DUF4124 domain-containing protein [unclassified Stenotrophomonas]|uniref:DUF4124 domain-containing protein n=1 Tax=unclassified Stenotrophomonas TaxID=196198 RepID=UPI00249A786C|nr:MULTISPECIES: DUF4124 domain-containing protein [unclassified Stenotrophomonas]
MRVLPLLCCLLLASASASAQNVYKWKDANGVTQYSEKPPANQKAEQRRMDTRAPVNTAKKADAPAESADCTQSRKNLALLNGQGEVMYDTNGDGKPDAPLSADQRKAQKSMAEAGVQAYCAPAA